MFDKLIDFLHALGSSLLPYVIVNEYQRGVILRFGKFRRLLEPGFHWMIPLGFEAVFMHSVVPSVHHLSPQSLSTADGHSCVCQVVVTWRVRNIKKMLLEVEDAPTALSDSVYGIVAQHVRRMKWDELAVDKSLEAAHREIRDRAFRWGIEVMQISFSDIQRCRSLRVWQEQKDVTHG